MIGRRGNYARVDYDLRSLDKSIKVAVKAGVDLRPVWRKVRTPLRQAQRKHITSMTDLKGRPFRGLAASTIQRRLYRGGSKKKYTKKGRLRKPVARKLGRILSKKLVSRTRVFVGRRSIKLYARGPMAHALHGGAKVGKKRRSKLPPRKYIYVDDPLARQAFDMVAKHVAESLENGKAPR